MRNKKFYDQNQASSYLRGTVIRVNDEPVYVNDVVYPDGLGGRGSMELEYSIITKGLGHIDHIKVSHKSVDMNPVPLGMCSYHDGDQFSCFYVQRYPVRKWKIGLAKENLNIIPTGENPVPANVALIFPNTSIAETIKGKYMGVEEALKTLKRRRGTIPFSRRFAVGKHGAIFYKTLDYSVGFFEGMQPITERSCKYLDEILMEDIRANP